MEYTNIPLWTYILVRSQKLVSQAEFYDIGTPRISRDSIKGNLMELWYQVRSYSVKWYDVGSAGGSHKTQEEYTKK